MQLGALAATTNPDGWTGHLRRIGVNSPECTGKGNSTGLTDVCDTRVLVFDLDDVLIPDFDPLDPVPGVQWFLQRAGLEDVSCVWQLTSSQKLGSDRARLRVWMISDREYAPRELKNYLKALPLELGVDPCMYNGNHAIYCAAPLVVKHDDRRIVVEDFISVRSALLRGEVDLAAIELPDEVVMDAVTRARREFGVGVGGMDIEYLAPGNECSPIMDGDLHGGFGNATWWLVKWNQGITLKEAVQVVVEYIELSDLERKGEAISRACSDEFAPLFEGAVTLQEGSKTEVVEVAPEFPTEEMSLEAASDALRRTVREFFDEGGQVLLDGAAGLGKTEEVIRQMPSVITLDWGGENNYFGDTEKTVLKFPAPTIDVYVPTHELAEEMQKRCLEHGRKAVVIRGRLWKPHEDADPICARHELVELMREKELEGEGSSLCVKYEGGQCPHWEGCEYIEQFKKVDMFTQVVIRTHNSIGIQASFVEAMLLDGRKPERVVIDESPLSALIQTDSWVPHELAQYPHPLVKKLVRAVEDKKNLVEVFADEVPALRELLEDYRRARKGGGYPSQTDEELRQELEKDGHPALPETAIARLLLAIKRKEKRFNGIWVGAKGKAKGKIHTAALAFNARDLRNAIVLDGTLDDILFSYVMPNARTVNLPVKRQANVYQVWNRSYSHSQIIKRGKALPNVVWGIQAFIATLQVQGKSVGLIAPKMIEEAVGHKPSAHFNALRGIDRLKDLDAGVIVGRVMPPEFAVEKIARALFPFEEMSFPGEYERRAAGYRLASGGQAGVLEWYHPDPLVNRVLRQQREAESSQAVDRMRLIHREVPADIYILARLPLDVTVDALIPDPLSVPKLLKLLAMTNWVLPLVPEWMVERMPDLFNNKNAAKNWMKQNVLDQKRGGPNIGREVTPVSPAAEHPGASALDCGSGSSAVTPGARVLRFLLRERHKRQADSNLPRLLTVLQDDDAVQEVLAGHFPDDSVLILMLDEQ